MRVAVTGGAGYIGSTLVRDLVNAGHNVKSIDNQSTGRYEHLKMVMPRDTELLNGDIRHSKDLDAALEGMDAVVHMAAISDLDSCNEKPEEAVSVNIYGTHQVVEAARRNGTRRLVFCSSAAVYGTPLSIPVTEAHSTRPLNLYGITKLAGESIINASNINYGLETINLRFGNVYGVGIYTNWVGVIPKFVSLALEGKPLTIYGDGASTRDFVHVEDVTKAIVLSLTTKGIKRETLNIGNQTTTVNEIAQIVSKEAESVTGKHVNVVHLPSRQGETREFSYNTKRIKTIVSFQPKWRLKEGVKQIMDYKLACRQR